MNNVRLLYVTTKDLDQARTMGRALLERGLIACANIFPKMESIYHWNDSVLNETEAVLILKTEVALVEKATQAILELHSYDTPCVLVVPVEGGSSAYLNWLLDQTRPAR